MDIRYNQFLLAAQEIARKHLSNENDWHEVCYKYGVFLDTLTEDEYDELDRLVEEYW